MKRISALLAGTLVLATTCSWALNITIPDGSYTGTGWYGDHEDQEVEPGMATGQGWDLEAFMLDGYSLSIVGGFDFENGQGGMSSGDIFLDTNGDYGGTGVAGNKVVTGNFGYEYVLALRLDAATEGDLYEVFALSPDASVVTVKYDQNVSSNPWRYSSGGTSVETGTFTLSGPLADAAFGDQFTGGTHYTISGFDLSFLTTVGGLQHGDQFTTHFTMECGNDNLMGKGILAPEPASLLLLGTGLTGLAGMVRRRTRLNT